MSSPPPGELRGLSEADEADALALLARAPERDLYLRGLLWRMGVVLPAGAGELLGFWREGSLRGVFLHSPAVVLSCEDDDGVAAFAQRAGEAWGRCPVSQLIAPRAMSLRFLDALRAVAAGPPRVRLLRDRMPLMRLRASQLPSLEAALPGPAGLVPAPLRPAEQSDREGLAHACRAVSREELGVDPQEVDPEGFREGLERRIRAGREYVWTERGRLMFRAAISAATPEAALIEGVWTPQEERGRGRGTRGMHALCRRLLHLHQRLVLFVDEKNLAAIRVYRRLGFETFDECQAVYFEAPAAGGARDGQGSGASLRLLRR
jgi:L-amino acid N-acyltransferase YncA